MAITNCSAVTRETGDQDKPDSPDFSLKESVFHGQVSFPVAIYADDMTGMEVIWHWHEELEIGWITKGEVIVSVGGAERVLRSGEGFFINAVLVHAMRNAHPGSPAELHSLVFHPSLVSGSDGSVFDEEYVKPVIRNIRYRYEFLEEERDREIMQHIKRAWEVIHDESRDYPIYARAELSLALAELARREGAAEDAVRRAGKADGGHGKDAINQARFDRTRQMLDIIHRRYGENLTLGEIAAEASVSVSEALRCFRQIVGLTPGQYLKKYRLARAAQLLKETEQPVADIGSQCGFADGSYFSKSFREIYHQNPAQYRTTNPG